MLEVIHALSAKKPTAERIAYLQARIIELQSGQRQWYEDHGNLVELATHLVDEYELVKAEEVLRFFEKPWKWNAEWKAHQESINAKDGMGRAAEVLDD